MTEFGETCQDRGWKPIGTLDDCTDGIDFVKKRYPRFPSNYPLNKIIEKNSADVPKGCYLNLENAALTCNECWTDGYFNTHVSGDDDYTSKTICIKTEYAGKKLKSTGLLKYLYFGVT